MGADPNQVSRVVAIETIFKNFRVGQLFSLLQRVALVGLGATSVSYSLTKKTVTSAVEVGETYGFGSPLHLAALELLPVNGDGIGTIPLTIYPLDKTGLVVSTGELAITGTATANGSIVVNMNEIKTAAIPIVSGETAAQALTKIVAAVAANLNMPADITDEPLPATITVKWGGETANKVNVTIEGSVAGLTITPTNPSTGTGAPDVTDATGQFGDVWETMVINTLDIDNTTALDAYKTFGEGRWGATTKKPLIVFTGNTEATLSTAISVTDARKTDFINSQLVAPGSNNLYFVVAARQVARIVTRANEEPPYDYGSLNANTLTPGTDAEQWNLAQREAAVLGGSSTVKVKDSVVYLSDIVTMYHPTGDPSPAYRFVVDIVRLQNIIYNLDLIFNSTRWDGVPLVPDNQPVASGSSAKKPKTAKADIAALLDALGLAAIISDPETAKANTTVVISPTNNKRLDIVVPVQLSGNANVISIDLNFGFYYGGA